MSYVVVGKVHRSNKTVGARGVSPALREALRLVRDAWPDPSQSCSCFRPGGTTSGDTGTGTTGDEMERGVWPGGVGASPGLLRRRYSMPETIMRKYRLAQQRSELEDSGEASSSSAGIPRSACGACCSSRSARRDPMRKSALMRMWGRACACTCVMPPRCSCATTRSLGASRCELRPRSPRCLTPVNPIRLPSTPLNNRQSTYNSPPRYDLSSSSDRPEHTTVSSDTQNFTSQSDKSYAGGTKVELITNHNVSDVSSLTDSSETYSTSLLTAKEKESHAKYHSLLSSGSPLEGGLSARSGSVQNNESDVLPYDQPLSIETQKYDILEIVVSETMNVRSMPPITSETTENIPSPIRHLSKNRKTQNINIDEYVSNILVESLNSLTGQLESMNASMGNDKKLNIVEKEIKVKLQNTGVNTIVHLSPTSNNQIIFGNEELCHSEERLKNENLCLNSSCLMRDSAFSFESNNNNLTSPESIKDNNCNQQFQKSLHAHPENLSSVTNNDSFNKSILQQIQKLFKDEFQRNEHNLSKPSVSDIPEISHVEISNVDVYLNDNDAYPEAETIEIQTQNDKEDAEMLGGVGAANYYKEIKEPTLVPRFSALPHSDSMEVNTSSSEDADMLGSECASLVDSLDDPNSPRSLLLRRAHNKRSELVRSSIDVLDLLPENVSQNENHSPKEKGEAFFIRIKDDDCDCEKENIIVADHMPETIKQRLYRRHRKREQRMECVRRSKVKQMKIDVMKQRLNENYRAKKEMEKECTAIVNALIDDVIGKIAQDEYKCMKIKQRTNKSDDVLKRKKDIGESSKVNKTKVVHSHSCSEYRNLKQPQSSEKSNRDKSSRHLQLPPTPVEQRPKRIYQKSEIHDGNKCIEILEILEYVNSSQSSSETTNSDENHNNFLLRNKKSRIPVPVYERFERLPRNTSQKKYKNGRLPSTLAREKNDKTKHLLASMLLDAFAEDTTGDPARRAPVALDPPVRSNSLRFQNHFDIIPEEKSSLSMESTGDDTAVRRASAPRLEMNLPIESDYKDRRQSPKTSARHLKSAGTSPMSDWQQAQKDVGTATSPMPRTRDVGDPAGNEIRKSVTTQCDEPRRNVQRELLRSRERNIKSHSCLKNTAVKEIARERRRKCEREKDRSGRMRGGCGCDQCEESGSSSESSGTPLCSGAWRAARRRRARQGDWAVTVAGSCAAALPNDVEMRLRFPDASTQRYAQHTQGSPPRPHVHCDKNNSCPVEHIRTRRHSEEPPRLTLTVRKEASDSSVLASKSMKKSHDLLPELHETFRASRTNTKSSLKTRRGCSPHCWLPDGDFTSIRAREGLSVSGNAIVPEQKPRVPTMSERDLTRLYTPRRRFSYLRS
ncbi:unnamed protein product [Leptosia nina]|uniref:Uncharacterized protein n=1 Tax=Leptosia nina TaxID=320188 RepID=A0AAV1JEB2_9NEOP